MLIYYYYRLNMIAMWYRVNDGIRLWGMSFDEENTFDYPAAHMSLSARRRAVLPDICELIYDSGDE